MEIILLKDIEKVGDRYEVVTVKDGYGRNYLIPQRLAIIANESNMARLEEYRAKKAAELEARLDEFRAIQEKVQGAVLKIGAKAGTSGKIFGSVTTLQIANMIQETFGVEVDRRDITIPEEVKTVGTYTAVLDLHPDVQANINFEVIAE